MPSDLEACPFCGGKAEEIHLRHMGHDGHRIYCTSCSITTETMASRDAVVERWNSRRDDAVKKLQRKVRNQRRELKQLKQKP